MGIFLSDLYRYRQEPSFRMMKLLLLTCLAGMTFAAPKIEPLCTMCVDVITDLDEFITADTTEDQIVDFAKNLCQALGLLLPDLETACNDIMNEQLPTIIEGLVNDNLNPTEICTSITICP